MERLQRMVMKNMTSSDSSSQPIIDAIPASLLESFIPGFGIISRIFFTHFGIDLSRIVLTVFVLAGFLTALRQSRRVFNSFINDYLGANIIIESDDDLYQQVMDWISGNVVTENARELTATTKRINPWSSQNNAVSTGIFNFKEFDARFPPSFIPAHGTHRFWFRGRVFWMYRERRNVQPRLANPFAPVKEEETIRLMTLGRRTAPIKRLLDECKSQAASKQRESTSVRYADTSRGTPIWRRAGQRPTRPLDTIYLAQKTKTDLLEDIQDFLHPSAWGFYSRRGIPYRRGYLFHGQPGTGKTSLSVALAGMFGLTLYMLSLSDSSFTDQNLSQLLANLPTSCIVLVEDIDTVAVSRKSDAEEKPQSQEISKGNGDDKNEDTQKGRFNKRNVGGTPEITLSGLLNAIDGVASQEGRILIMTTNAPEALDPALIRPGRVDKQVYFGFLTKDCARQMFLTMFGDDENPITADSKDLDTGDPLGGDKSTGHFSDGSAKVHSEQTSGRISNSQAEKTVEASNLEQLADQFVDLLPEASLTPAAVQGFLLTRRHNPKRAILELDAWAKETLAAKAKGLNVVRQVDETASTAASSPAVKASTEVDPGNAASKPKPE